MNFTEAMRALMNGKKIKNEHWNAGQYITRNSDRLIILNDGTVFDTAYFACNFPDDSWLVVEDKHPKLKWLHERLLLHYERRTELDNRCESYIKLAKGKNTNRDCIFFCLPAGNASLASAVALVFSECLEKHGGVVLSGNQIPDDLKERFLFGVYL